MHSIFDFKSMYEPWEDHILKMTPVELRTDLDTFTDLHFKREDYFAPLGYGGINGSKLRQCIFLADMAKERGCTKMINGTVVGSPQAPMGAAVFANAGMSTTTILGATKPSTCIRHPMIKMAAWFGSDFGFVGSAYNSTIQPKCRYIQDAEKRFYVEYGITLDHEDNPFRTVAGFHHLGGKQVQNIPRGVHDLIIPFGSANSACSILAGLAKYGFADLKRVHLIGIGPNKMKYLQERIDIIGEVTNQLDFTSIQKEVKLEHHDLHGTNWVKYNDLMPDTFADIDLHPRYEGKVMRYVRQNLPHLIKDTSLFWIVGSEPSIEAMMPYCPQLGEVPTSIKEYEEEL